MWVPEVSKLTFTGMNEMDALVILRISRFAIVLIGIDNLFCEQCGRKLTKEFMLMVMVMLMRSRNTERPVITGPGTTNDNKKKRDEKGQTVQNARKSTVNERGYHEQPPGDYEPD